MIDGEAMEREQAGAFYTFDLLEREGVSLRALPFAERIVRLKDELLDAGLIDQAGATVKRMVSAVPGLGLLFPAVEQEDKAAVLDEVRDSGGEGIVIRDMNGPSVAGDSRHELKIKFKGELDVVALEHQLRGGMVAGTFVIGVRRESDNAWIAIGNANSGLNHTQFEQVKAALHRGESPVLRIEFLTARTVGISPVEPVIVEIRSDKKAEDCVAGQLVEALGAERGDLINSAIAWQPRSQAA